MRNKKLKVILIVLAVLAYLALFFFMTRGSNFAMINPKGVIAYEQKKLMTSALILMLAVVIPVFCIGVYIVYNFRAEKNNPDYKPKSVASPLSALMLWLVSITTITIIGVMIWESSHRLDPYKKIESANKELTIQVVALNWKWLFIYPEQGIATVNFITVPKNTPIHFRLTADAPMNALWIPQLGGQMYAMAGMENQLYLMADHTGEFNGSATEINGKGYAGMRFKVNSVEQKDFESWVTEIQKSSKHLNIETYNQLAQESENNPAEFYSGVEPGLFDTIIKKFMAPMPESGHGDMEVHMGH